MKKRTLMLMLLPLVGCQTTYEWDTNFNPEKIGDYFMPATVKLVKQVSEQAAFKGEVSQTACSTTPPVKEQLYIELRTELRRQAAKLDANQLIVDICETYPLEDNQRCPIQSSCIGRAFAE